MYHLKVPVFIDSAHQLPDSDSLTTKKCTNLHGHTYLITVEGYFNRSFLKDGMTIDFGAVKDLVNELDHQFINKVFKKYNIAKSTTAENIAWFIAHRMTEKFGEDSFVSLSVSVCEGFKGEKSSFVQYVHL